MQHQNIASSAIKTSKSWQQSKEDKRVIGTEHRKENQISYQRAGKSYHISRKKASRKAGSMRSDMIWAKKKKTAGIIKKKKKEKREKERAAEEKKEKVKNEKKMKRRRQAWVGMAPPLQKAKWRQMVSKIRRQASGRRHQKKGQHQAWRISDIINKHQSHEKEKRKQHQSEGIGEKAKKESENRKENQSTS